jgi:hypothetical protein
MRKLILLSALFAMCLQPAAAADGAATPESPAPQLKTQPLETNPPTVTSIRSLKRQHYKKYGKTAVQLARYHWLDKAAEANPTIISAICAHRKSAKILADHPRIAEIADVDHYVCRRITKWRGASLALVRNPHCDHVIALDPEGIYRAIRRDPKIARELAISPMFNKMIIDNPDLATVIARHM